MLRMNVTLGAWSAGDSVNVYSENNYILAFLYLTSRVPLGNAGTQAVQGVHDVQSVNISDMVTGHLKYQHMVGPILSKIGWADVDDIELSRQEAILRQLAEAKKRKKEGEDGEVESDEKKLEEETRRLQEAQAVTGDENVQRRPSNTMHHQ
jgi:hypothetical protein